MHFFKYALGSLALAGGALAQGGGLLSVFAQSQTCDPGAITGLESGLVCGTCYPLNQVYPSVYLGNIGQGTIWGVFGDSSCNSEITQMQGGGCLGGSVSAVRIACPGATAAAVPTAAAAR
ncbi:hypothetical protein B0H16DRAFT_595191 [Mycena metata]|uniref:Uncharacterized protein n=1 Tax=Mycena metata TaxID=1033252 RepID=A0AAD7J8U3_9AGAR|nr:hypothetical protein B0H16DRAFT_595191 [Mycena metata]